MEMNLLHCFKDLSMFFSVQQMKSKILDRVDSVTSGTEGTTGLSGDDDVVTRLK